MAVPIRVSAHHAARGAVQFHHLAVGHPGLLVQPVHILRDHPDRHPGPLEFGDRPVR